MTNDYIVTYNGYTRVIMRPTFDSDAHAISVTRLELRRYLHFYSDMTRAYLWRVEPDGSRTMIQKYHKQQ